MQIILWIVSALFGGLSLVAALSQWKKEGVSLPAILMITGSLLLLAAVVCNLLRQRLDFAVALLGCMAICAAAIGNGKKSGQFHFQHHILRASLSLLLIVGFAVF